MVICEHTDTVLLNKVLSRVSDPHFFCGSVHADPDPGGIRGRGLGVKEKMIFFEFFFTFRMILTTDA